MRFKNINDAVAAGKSVKFDLAIVLDGQDLDSLNQSGQDRLIYLLRKVIAEIEDGNNANYTTSEVDVNLYANDAKQTLINHF